MKKNNTKTVTLTLTNKCNLNCVYCYENHKDIYKMSYKTAKKIIDKEFLDNSTEFIQFDLFGGEPFLEFDLIKQIYYYISGKYADKKWIVFITTNGTLVKDEVQNWLSKNTDKIKCGLSLDGTRDMHNINRSNSFDKIDLQFFLNKYPIQPVKMTISKETLPFLSEGIVFLHKLGFKITANLAQGIKWENNSIFKFEEEILKLMDFYINNPTIEVSSILNLGIEYIKLTNDSIRKYCGVGSHMHTYDVFGNCYPCQFFMPLSIGEERSEKSKALNFEEHISIKKLDVKCQECIINSICPTCYGINYFSSDNIYHKDDMYCQLIKIQFWATSYLKYKKWEKNLLELNQNEEFYLLKSIELVQNKLI